MIKVTAIKLPDAFDIYKNTDGEKAEFLEPVSKINIFVGSNNSGKSRFMREISRSQLYNVKPQDIDLEDIDTKLSEYIQKVNHSFDSVPFHKIGKTSKDELNLMFNKLNTLLTFGEDKYDLLRIHFEELSSLGMKTAHGKNGSTFANDYPGLQQQRPLIEATATNALEVLNEIPVQTEDNAPQKVYTPTLRGLRPLDDAYTDYYLATTRSHYLPEQLHIEPKLAHIERKNLTIFTGLSLHKRLTDLLLGNNSERKLINDYQKFISQALFEGRSVALIPNQEEKAVIVKIGKEAEHPIHHLGDGIQSAIILSFLPFIMQEQTFFFIEEPEMFLHPGLQR